MDNKEILKVIQGIQQVLANVHDGAVDDKGDPIKVGLKREVGHPVINSRIMDGFYASIAADKLILKYQSEIKLKEVHSPKFESDIDSLLEDIVKYIKKEYKKNVKEDLGLSKIGESMILVQRTSNIRTWVEATATYKISNIGLGYDKDVYKKKFDDKLKKWFEMAKPSRRVIKQIDEAV